MISDIFDIDEFLDTLPDRGVGSKPQKVGWNFSGRTVIDDAYG